MWRSSAGKEAGAKAARDLDGHNRRFRPVLLAVLLVEAPPVEARRAADRQVMSPVWSPRSRRLSPVLRGRMDVRIRAPGPASLSARADTFSPIITWWKVPLKSP